MLFPDSRCRITKKYRLFQKEWIDLSILSFPLIVHLLSPPWRNWHEKRKAKITIIFFKKNALTMTDLGNAYQFKLFIKMWAVCCSFFIHLLLYFLFSSLFTFTDLMWNGMARIMSWVIDSSILIPRFNPEFTTLKKQRWMLKKILECVMLNTQKYTVSPM